MKTMNIFKKLGAAVMAMSLVCSMAISASAATNSIALGEYEPVLTVAASVPHDLDFFDGNALVEDGVTVTAPLLDEATVTVTLPSGVSYSATGYIQSAVIADESTGYEVSIDEDNNLVVVAPAGTTQATFAPVITFTVAITSTEGTVTRHQTVNATLSLKTIEA